MKNTDNLYFRNFAYDYNLCVIQGHPRFPKIKKRSTEGEIIQAMSFKINALVHDIETIKKNQNDGRKEDQFTNIHFLRAL